MPTITLGTAAPTTLTGVAWNPMSPVGDLATIRASLKHDINPAHPVFPGGFSNNGMLFVPNRGMLRLLPGDYIAVDVTGWPILVAAAAAASASWVHT